MKKILYFGFLLILLYSCSGNNVSDKLVKDQKFMPSICYQLLNNSNSTNRKIFENNGFMYETEDGDYYAYIYLPGYEQDSIAQYSIFTSKENLKVNNVQGTEYLFDRKYVRNLSNVWSEVILSEIDNNIWLGYVLNNGSIYEFADGVLIDEYKQLLNNEKVKNYFTTEEYSAMQQLVHNNKSMFDDFISKINFSINKKGFAETYANIIDVRRREGSAANISYGYLGEDFGSINMSEGYDDDWGVNYNNLNITLSTTTNDSFIHRNSLQYMMQLLNILYQLRVIAS